MSQEQQPLKLVIPNFDVIIGDNKQLKRHGSLFPSALRALILGPSGCGKTNALLAMLLQPTGLRFQNLYVYSKSLNQPKYMYLKNILDPLKCVGYFTFSDNEQVILPSDVLPNSVMVFDDISCEKQDSVKQYFCMGRHKGVDSLYLAQTYSKVPKQLVRDNVNFLLCFRQDEMNLKHIYDDHVNTDMNYNKFKEICLQCWNKDKYGFLIIDKESEMNKGRYRNKFDKYLLIKDNNNK